MDLLKAIELTFGTQRDDDSTDRLNHIYTTMLLVIFSVVVTSAHYVGHPIMCWCPAQFTENYVKYANKVCWVKNTYYIPMNQTVPETNGLHKPQLRYYQWVPFILLSLALFYQIPCYIWRGNNENSGMNIENIMSISDHYMNSESFKEKDACVKMLTRHFERYLKIRKRRKFSLGLEIVQEIAKIFCFWRGKKYTNYLTRFYLFTKLSYLINTIAQFILIDILLTGGIHFYGYRLFSDFVTGKKSYNSVYFPRVTLCDFHVREMGFEAIGHRYTVQCVLSINLFSEAIFAFYWFWLVILMIFNTFSFIKWLVYSLPLTSSVLYVRKHIRYELINQPISNASLKDFVHKYLGSDGVFALRLISHNSSDTVVSDLLSSLYENYKISHIEIDRLSLDY